MQEISVLPKIKSREDILAFIEHCKSSELYIAGDSAKEDNQYVTYRHSFPEGVYIREMYLKQGARLVGEIQKLEHAIFLMNGTIDLATEEGTMRVSAPFFISAKPGTQRIGYAVTDVVWVNVHPNPTNTKDLKEIQKMVTAESFEDYDKFVESQKLITE